MCNGGQTRATTAAAAAACCKTGGFYPLGKGLRGHAAKILVGSLGNGPVSTEHLETAQHKNNAVRVVLCALRRVHLASGELDHSAQHELENDERAIPLDAGPDTEQIRQLLRGFGGFDTMYVAREGRRQTRPGYRIDSYAEVGGNGPQIATREM